MIYDKIALEDLLNAIKGSGAIMSRVAAALDVDWTTAKRAIDLHPEAQLAMANEKETNVDNAESVILKHIREDNLDAAKYYLGKIGRKRGYGDKIEVEVTSDTFNEIKKMADEFRSKHNK